MISVEKITPESIASSDAARYFPAKEHMAGKRRLTATEKEILIQNRNRSSDPEWNNVYVSEEFDPALLCNTEFQGVVVLGRLTPSTLKYHDLILRTGVYNSLLRNVVVGDDCVIRNVRYLKNYRIGNRVILFNIQEMSCTNHCKFGNGVLKDGEAEDDRIWIGVANENDGRSILPFESMIPADAYIWSRNRGDAELMNRFKAITEKPFSTARNTFGIVEDDVIIKNTTLIKDAKICSATYIKGAFKLKNITVLSSEAEPSQIGEGVEMVNGIMGYGSKVFYQAVAVRFIIGRNCQLKYGARLLNTVLGDNSTVSCCELLNNLIFPFHEQHHNSSFLIAATVMGQSNIASGATIGSNHNSRSPDGEIYAERGFWPGLCSDFKHNSRFAAFSLIAKGSYQSELNITYPFSLVSSNGPDEPITIMPAYWFRHNMFAMARNNSKFLKRDKRKVKVQHIETDPLAPDTVQEILASLDRIITLTKRWLMEHDAWFANKTDSTDNLYQLAKDYLHHNVNSDIILEDNQCMKRYGARIINAAQGYKEYRKVAKYFACKTLAAWCSTHGGQELAQITLTEITDIPLFTDWVNVGGQIIPQEKLNELFAAIKAGTVDSWDQVHAFYDDCQQNYDAWKARYAVYVMEQLYSRTMAEFTADIYRDIYTDVIAVSNYMYESSISSRQKDYTDYFRSITYENEEEMLAVVGRLEDNSFLKELKRDTERFNLELETLFASVL
ncbi:MAG: DUF4954 family protein [Treponemataceae bacterium]|nr:DUF4954 family protein [Treponemataceae bacterium]